MLRKMGEEDEIPNVLSLRVGALLANPIVLEDARAAQRKKNEKGEEFPLKRRSNKSFVRLREVSHIPPHTPPAPQTPQSP